MSTRTAELLMGFGMLLFSLCMMWSIYNDGLNIGWLDGRGPGSGVWPFW
jgi:putative tricarboxylic transport membrane protein